MLGLGWIFGQDEASVAIGDYAPNELVVELEKACEDTKDPKQGLELYDELWSKVSAARERSSRLKLEKELRGEAFESYDEQALNQGVIKWLKFAFCHQDVKKCPGIGMDWRKSGVAVARTFFGLKRAREELARAGFVAQLLILSLPEDEDEDDANGRQDDGQEDTASARRHMELQIYVAEVLAEIVQYAEFSVYMCSIAVLNFVCICLNQVPEAIDYAARVLSKLSDDESNLVILMEASVGSVLEYFFNTCNHKRYSEDGRGAATWRGSASTADDQLRQYNRDISALSDCARVLGTLIQFSHEVRVHLPTLIGVFWGAVDPSSRRARKPDAATDDVRLLAELARLLYWEFRRDTDNMEVLLNAAEDSSVDHVLETLARIWSRCVEMHMFLTDNGGEFARAVEAAAESDQELPTHLQLREHFLDSEDEQAYRKKCPIHPRELLSKIRYARMLLCYMNCALWILLPLPQIRWKMIDMGWKKLHYAFDLQDEVNLRTVLATVRFVVDMPHSLTCHDFLDFFADQLIIIRGRRILDNELEVDHLVMGEGDIMLFLDALSVLALQRGMQLKLASHDLYNKLQLLLAQVEQKLVGASPEVLHAIEFAALRAAAQVAVHPAHRLSWIGPTVPYPDPELFGVALRRYLKQGNDSARTIASLLLTIQSEKFDGPVGEYEATFRSILTWWRANSTATYEATLSAQVNEEREGAPVPAEPASLQQQLELARRRRAEGRSLTFRAALQVTLPHPSILALSLFSRMALEPRFKRGAVGSSTGPWSRSWAACARGSGPRRGRLRR
ncbi:unnamed protein product [Prorocentrum cordatum]|uniref:Nuclear pore complex protein n=1 Tax=Prorocentrum cordatum TaxID=2364126 RepID=A0ABN9UCF1_9DINO|nr:unnamed protein product [Polarella glacialis]